ncbi:MAG: carbamoyl phosphate synthase large subunit [Alphaproteobacteria bacterium]|nr:carbamoyl phosphate synthase large subunit [Alphaproteobacteria bacterium]
MPKRTDIKSILIIGAGPIVIGQACEFDYSGTQAVKTLKAEGYRVILVNSNPATIMTDPDFADATYIEPITPAFVEKIIAKERPDALLPTMGGQTALNCAKALAESGVLAKYNVELIGASLEAINKAENRDLFNQAMQKIGLECAKNGIAHSIEEARDVLKHVGLPAIIRPSFTLGGSGGGIAYNREEFEQIVASGLDASPTHEVLIDESVLGWKEYEMEVVRDKADNCIIICSIENIDPMGVHTGDSITVAPALTLTDKEYQIMRDASLAVLREIGVDTGGSNVQFAVNPADGRMVVIEMNPRVSRSSALASKATGFPIAKVAAKLAVGYTLDEVQNDITKVTPASFEPTIDYVVTKIPRFAFEKFPGAEAVLSTAMKSVGEVMAIGRSFPESLQKALRSMETGLTGLDEIEVAGASADNLDPMKTALAIRTPDRLLKAAQALRLGMSVAEICRITAFDPWFVRQLQRIVEAEFWVKNHGLPRDAESLMQLKQLGFGDAKLAQLSGMKEGDIRALRHTLGVTPVFKRVDTCAAEFASPTPYLYSCYETRAAGVESCEAQPSERQKIVILGGGPNRIGQGIEFDYCCVHASYALREAGFETIMVNCNPETVSTDYDTSDRLYFEPLTIEDVLAILEVEKSRGTLKGVIVQYGGQTPLKLAHALEEAGMPIIGTSVDAIDVAEDRERFQQLLHTLKLKQPANAICRTAEEVVAKAESIGFPVVIRPSYVLGGRAMRIIHSPEALAAYVQELLSLFGDGPILLDSYLQDATELDVDCICDRAGNTFVAGIMEHIEEAGIHSGDSACSLPPYSLSPELIAEVHRQTIALAKALNVVGLMNVQFAVKDGEIFILEVNPRASRTVPFVAKATGIPIAKIAARIMAGAALSDFTLPNDETLLSSLKHVAVKEAVFPFARFPGVDIVLGPEMKSTGESMGIDRDFARAYAKAHIAAGAGLPLSGTVFVSVKDRDKKTIAPVVAQLLTLGFKVVCTRGTGEYLQSIGHAVDIVNKVREGRPHIVDLMKDGMIQLVFNTTEGEEAMRDSASIRKTALFAKIPYSTTISGAWAIVQAIDAFTRDVAGLDVAPLQDYVAASASTRAAA